MDPNNQIESSGSGVPLKRKRGRPRKDPSLKQHSGRRSHIPPGFEAAQHHPPPPPQTTTTTTAPPDPVVGQAVNGVIEASFDGGYLLSVKFGDSTATLRGVLFKPGNYVPVTTENDIAPHVPMIRREGGHFSTEAPQSSSRGQKLAVQRAKHNQAQSNPVPVIHQTGNFQVGFGVVGDGDGDVHVVEPISMLPPDRVVPVGQLFSGVGACSSPREENGSMGNDGASSEAEKSKSKPVASASVDTTDSSHFSGVNNMENGKQASKTCGDLGIAFSKQETGNGDSPGNVNLGMNFSVNTSRNVDVSSAPFLNFGTGRMTDLLQAVQENVKDSNLHVAEQAAPVANVDFPQTMASETDQLFKAGDP